jgi:hypothetical protein
VTQNAEELIKQIFEISMSGIYILNWTYIWQRSILAPVSTILLQENSFKPASSGLFFALFSCCLLQLEAPARLRVLRDMLEIAAGRLGSDTLLRA